MNFDWSHYLKLAEILVNNTKNTPLEEAAYRAAISRAYYAVFCSCRNFVRTQSDKIILADDATDHGTVRRYFREQSDKELQKIGRLLGNLRDDRNSADYNDEYYGNLAKDSTKVIKQAKQVLKLLAKL